MLAIHPKIVYRVPRFSIHANLPDSWNELKSSIAESSPEFYIQIQNIERSDLNTLPPKIFTTVWKYFNRAKFRATPYGSFAGIGIFDNDIQEQEGIVISNKQQFHRLIDWNDTASIEKDFAKMIVDDVFVQANSSYYKVGDAIRFVAKTDDGFSLSELDADENIMAVLNYCKMNIRLSKLINDLSIYPEINELIEHLISNQLLLTSLSPNIIGTDYFQRIGVIADPSLPKYTITERCHINGGLQTGLLKHLPSAVDILNQLNRATENKKLAEFIVRFTRKFEQNEVSILTALDPELGVGYDDLEQSAFEDPFLAELSGSVSNETNKNHNLTDVFIKALLNTSTPLVSLDLENLPVTKNEAGLLPNTMSALCYASGETLVIDSIGGCTATSLLGRFTCAHEDLHSFCKELATIEQEANPEVLFFDIAYQSERNVDNVNRRKSIFDLQLSILDYDTTDFPLALNDLYISVKNGEVVVRSERLNKRLVPRMSTAYNYNRSDLSVFRLLCDLQHQKINSNLSFSLQSLLPDLAYYPRLFYKNLVLSARKWKINFNEKTELINREIAKILGSDCKVVKHGMGDQTLCYNLESEADLAILIEVLKKHKSIYLEEVLINDGGNMKEENGAPYLGQFVISLFHRDTIYNGVYKLPSDDKTDSIIKSFPAGSNWLYFQIFVHTFRADDLLVNEISHLLNEYKEYIGTFFFIRYNEDGNHIRLRLKVKDVSKLNRLLDAFAGQLSEKVNDGLISEVRICTYKREGQRYGWNRIEAVEEFFFQDSQSTLALLATGASTRLKYLYTLELIEGIRKADLFSDSTFEALLNRVSSSLNKEHHFSPKEFRLLNENYKSFTSEFSDSNDNEIYFPVKAIIKNLSSLLSSCESITERQKLFGDLVHMHVNRLHASKQRMHEAVTYYFACKKLLQRKALTRKKPIDLKMV